MVVSRSIIFGAKSKIAFAITALTAGAGVATSEDPATSLKLCTTVPLRLFRVSLTAAAIAFDYEYSLLGLPEDSIERTRVKHEVHTRSARRLEELCFKNGGIYIKLGQHIDYEYSLLGLPEDSIERTRVKHEVHTRSARRLEELCFKNGGIYIKLGQHIGQLEYLVPQEYIKTLRESMLNRCPTSSYDQVCQVVKKELGGAPEEIFDEFDPVPIASASLAQVHVARTHQGQKVAVKVQHMHMTDTAAADYATVEFIVNTLHRLFPSFDYRWLVDEVHDSLPKELDFLNEAKNSIKCMDNFRKLSPHIADYVYAPAVYWNLSTTKLLIMEFVEGAEVNDLKSIQKLGINPHDVARLVSRTFAEMMFKHGFVHCDPHAANLLVRTLPSSKRGIFGRRKPQLALLDHGLYKVLDNSVRTNYAALWKALVLADANGIKENCLKLGAGEDLYALFAGILTMRPWNRVIDPAVDHLAIQGNASDHSELQMYASLYFPQITELLHKLPRVILLMLKTNDCLRSVNNALIKRPSVESFIIIGRVSSEALIEEKLSHAKSLYSLLHVWLEDISLKARFLIMQVALWILQFRTALAL